MAVFTSDFLNKLEEHEDFASFVQIHSDEWFVLRFYFYYKNLRKGLKQVSYTSKLRAALGSVWGVFAFPFKLFFVNKGKRLLVINNAEVVTLGRVTKQKLYFGNPLSDDSILIEKFTNWQKPVSNKRSISFLAVQLSDKFFSKFLSLSLQQIENCKAIDFALAAHRKEYLISEFNSQEILKRFNFYVMVWRALLSWIQPREILLTDYYNVGNLALIKAAHELGLKVIELQHGLISEAHTAYFFSRKLSRNLVPDELLYFLPIDFRSEQFYIDPVNTREVEHPLFRSISGKEIFLKEFETNIRKNHKNIALFTLQDTSEKEMTELIVEIAHEFPETLFILLPRMVFSMKGKLPLNIYVDWSHNFYELLQIADFHLTHYSTCALEASIMGIKSICIDREQMASKMFKSEIEKDSPYLLIANDKTSLVAILKTF